MAILDGDVANNIWQVGLKETRTSVVIRHVIRQSTESQGRIMKVKQTACVTGLHNPLN